MAVAVAVTVTVTAQPDSTSKLCIEFCIGFTRKAHMFHGQQRCLQVQL